MFWETHFSSATTHKIKRPSNGTFRSGSLFPWEIKFVEFLHKYRSLLSFSKTDIRSVDREYFRTPLMGDTESYLYGVSLHYHR